MLLLPVPSVVLPVVDSPVNDKVSLIAGASDERKMSLWSKTMKNYQIVVSLLKREHIFMNLLVQFLQVASLWKGESWTVPIGQSVHPFASSRYFPATQTTERFQ